MPELSYPELRLVYLSVAVGVEEHQIHKSVVLVVAIPMMKFEVLLDLNHLPTDGAASVLLP